MSMTTYTELQASIGNWLNREDLTAFIPDFIALFEDNFGREARVREMLVRAVTVPAADEPRENLPADFLELKAIQFNSNPVTVPDYVTPAWLRNYRRHAVTTGTPRYYTIEGSEFLFDVTPSDVELEILYYQKLPALSGSVDTNWLLSAHRDIYLYGSLVHSAPFLKDDERIATWDTLYQRALAALKKQDNRGQVNSAPVTIRTRIGRGIP